jgi:hypothetical protein
MLQAFALLSYLQSLGHDAKVIDYLPNYMPSLKMSYMWVPKKYNFWGIKQLYRKIKLRDRQLEQQRRCALEEFYKQYISVTEEHYQSIDDLRSNPPEADLYIAGSDQIWNTSFRNGLDASFYLDFGTPKRKISYAASFATTELKDRADVFVKKQLGNLDSISVREESALKILERLGYQGCMVSDPVFLLSRKQWNQFDMIPFSGEKYILTYDFEKNGCSVAPVVKRLARLNKCKVYSVSPFKHAYADQNFVDVGPDAFVSLIKHAHCVVSNSFHGTAFSLIFGKNFFVVKRKDGLNIRMQDILGRYGLDNRIVNAGATDEMLLRTIDYKKVERMMSIEIESSKSYLKQQIELAR